MTAAVWVRGALSDDYGVPSSAIEWVQGGLEDAGRIPFEPVEPRGVTLSVATWFAPCSMPHALW
jgi:hypothetical protein